MRARARELVMAGCRGRRRAGAKEMARESAKEWWMG